MLCDVIWEEADARDTPVDDSFAWHYLGLGLNKKDLMGDYSTLKEVWLCPAEWIVLESFFDEIINYINLNYFLIEEGTWNRSCDVEPLLNI